MKFVLFICVGIVAVFIAHGLGTIDSMPTLLEIEKSFLYEVKRHFIIVGASTSMIVCIVGYWLKQALSVVTALFLVLGKLYLVDSHVAAGDLWHQYGEAFSHFYFPYVGAGVPSIAALWFVAHRGRKRMAK